MVWRIQANLSTLALVRTTLPTRQAAEALGNRLVDDGLAACVHIQELASIYHWKGQRVHETEFVVEARTSLGRRGAVAKAMRDGHPYEVPLVESWPVGLVPKAYRRWALAQGKTTGRGR